MYDDDDGGRGDDNDDDDDCSQSGSGFGKPMLVFWNSLSLNF